MKTLRLHAALSVSDLRDRPEFFDTIADRVWNAWWRERGFPLSHITTLLREHLGERQVPFTLVAHDAGTFKGSVLVIASDLPNRMEYSPWVAALWIDAAYRRQGIGAALVGQAALSAFALGFSRAYLCATRANCGFYVKRHWQVLEEDVGPELLTVMLREHVVYKT